jgi:hypothetical protein
MHARRHAGTKARSHYNLSQNPCGIGFQPIDSGFWDSNPLKKSNSGIKRGVYRGEKPAEGGRATLSQRTARSTAYGASFASFGSPRRIGVSLYNPLFGSLQLRVFATMVTVRVDLFATTTSGCPSGAPTPASP